MEIPKIPEMASNEIEEGSATERVAQEETDYNSVSDVPILTLKVLMRIEKVNGDPLPESLKNPQQINVFCVQYAGEQPYCFIVVVSSFQLLNAFSETGYPTFYQ